MDFVRRDAEQEKKKENIHKIYKFSLACEQEILNVNVRECPKMFFSLNRNYQKLARNYQKYIFNDIISSSNNSH